MDENEDVSFHIPYQTLRFCWNSKMYFLAEQFIRAYIPPR